MTSIDETDRLKEHVWPHNDHTGFERVTSPLVGAALVSSAVAATVSTAACVDADGISALIALFGSAAVLTVAHLGLQLQAAVVILRDGRWGSGVTAACTVTMTLVALYLLATATAGGVGLLLMATGCGVVHTRRLPAPRDRTFTSPARAPIVDG
ncbi:hypothetical protein [Williamsia sp. M5A3_1d]